AVVTATPARRSTSMMVTASISSNPFAKRTSARGDVPTVPLHTLRRRRRKRRLGGKGARNESRRDVKVFFVADPLLKRERDGTTPPRFAAGRGAPDGGRASVRLL